MQFEFAEKYGRAISEVKSRHGEILSRIAQPAKQKSYKGKPSYVCPVCGHGKGGDGVTFNDEGLWHCFNCQTSGDVLKWYQLQTRCNGFYDALRGCCEVLGVKMAIDDSGASGGVTEALPPATKTPTAWERLQARVKWERKNDHYKTVGTAESDADKSALVKERTDYLARCAKCLADSDDPKGAPGRGYLRKRGLGDTGLWAFVGLGYDPVTGRITIPYNAIYTNLPSFTARKVGFKADGSAVSDKDSGALKYLDGGSKYLFMCPNIYELPEARRIYVCEGALDAVSVWYALGLDAMVIALNGVDNRQQLLDFVEHYRNNGGHDGVSIAKGAEFVLMLDNDEAGRRATEFLADGLARLGCVGRDIGGIWGADGDANNHCRRLAAIEGKPFDQCVGISREIEAALLNTPPFAPLSAAPNVEADGGVTTPADGQPVSGELLESGRVAAYLADVQNLREPLSTGIWALDSVMGGGFLEGLYIFGAVTGFGKTTLALQAANHIASQGRDVLIVSMEMSRKELWAKSVSRFTYELAKRKYAERNELERPRLCKELAQTAGQILCRYPTLSGDAKATVDQAMEMYNAYAHHLMVKEGIGDVTADNVRGLVQELQRERGVAPVVLVDYLQILAPSDVRSSDKQAIDKGVLALKRIARDFHTPVIGISSFNRANYDEPLNLKAFKESGAIEYASDMLLGMQYQGMDYADEDFNAAKGGEAGVDAVGRNYRRRVRGLRKTEEDAARKGEQPVHIQVKVLKNRNGLKNDCVLNFYNWFNYFDSAGLGNKGTIENPFDPDNPVILRK